MSDKWESQRQVSHEAGEKMYRKLPKVQERRLTVQLQARILGN